VLTNSPDDGPESLPPACAPSDKGAKGAEDSIELIRRAQDGEEQAYGRLFERYYERVHAIVRKRLGQALRAEVESLDIVQDAMVDAVRCFQNFELRDEGALTAWLAAIVENKIRGTRKYLYAEKRDRRRDVSIQCLAERLERTRASVFQPAADDTPPPDAIAKRAEIEVLLDSLEALPLRYREVVILRDQQGLAWDEIAARLERPSPDAARMLHAKAKIELLKEMKRRGY
jgi:RNA polymerase sigma-70 factor (ECF subfamily)